MDLLEKNKEMLIAGKYNVSDTRQLSKIAGLKNPNDYDLYLIACALCNYNIPEISEAKALRAEYFSKTRSSGIDYSHTADDYVSVDTKLRCTNTGTVNKYGLYEFELNINDRDLTNDLWKYKEKDCLKYVNNKLYPNKTIISIGKSQFENFRKMLDELCIKYDKKNLESGIIFTNKSTHKLIDTSTLDLPFPLYDFQIKDAEKILKTKRVLIGHEMGCGKTLISVLVGQSIRKPKLVICPEALRVNWYHEIKQAVHDADVHILYSNEAPHYGKDWTIVGYKTAVKFLVNLKKFECLFIDECQNCKAVSNWGKPTSKRANAAIEIAQAAEYCYLLSGTPIPARNKDLFNILKMLKCEKFNFDSQWAFKNYADKFCDPKETAFGKDYSGNSNSTELHDILNDLMIRRRRCEVLPHLTKRRQFIPIDCQLKKDYQDIEERLYHPRHDKDGKLLDTYMGLAMTGRKLLSQYKVDYAIELAESVLNSDESVVIVTSFIDTADKLKAHFKDQACEIRGGMTDTARNIAKEEFQTKQKPVCILNIDVGGVGLTLTAAHTMIIIDYIWNPTGMTQVEDRICRSGQNEDCLIYYICCENSTFDHLFIDMITDKSANIDLVVDNTENTCDLSAEREKSLIDRLTAIVENNTYGLDDESKKAI